MIVLQGCETRPSQGRQPHHAHWRRLLSPRPLLAGGTQADVSFKGGHAEAVGYGDEGGNVFAIDWSHVTRRDSRLLV